MSIIFIGLNFLLFLIVLQIFGDGLTILFLGLISLLFVLVPFLNYLDRIKLSRILLSLTIPVMGILLSVLTKKMYPIRVESYYEIRLFILIASVIPPIIFTLEERKELYGILSFDFLLVVLFDPIHNFFDVGYDKTGLEASGYLFITLANVLSFFFIIGSIFALIRTARTKETEKEELLQQLNEQNEDLLLKNKDIENQKIELVSANKRIEEQSEELANKNQELEFLINEKTRNLVETNNELVQYNNELRQFSYTISHNLRAPVASLIGLTNIINKEDLSDDNRIIIDHIRSSADKLDNVFKDLNKIIDLRNTLGAVKEKVVLQKEIREIKNLLKNEIENSGTIIEENLKIRTIYSIRPFVNSILYNLISNGIKYRSKDRKPVITISSSRTDHQIIIEVADNGMGMDVDAYKEDIFKMYKRFHQHTEGKGLGLYLVKLQAESMGGSITVKSKINRGSSFQLVLDEKGNVEDQTVFETSYCRVFYDASSNTTGIIWKRAVDHEEYKEAFTRSMDVFRQFKTPNWISDLNNFGTTTPENQKWMMDSVLPDAIEYGLKTLAIVVDYQNMDEEQKQYIEGICMVFEKNGVETSIFKSMQDGKSWLFSEDKGS